MKTTVILVIASLVAFIVLAGREKQPAVGKATVPAIEQAAGQQAATVTASGAQTPHGASESHELENPADAPVGGEGISVWGVANVIRGSQGSRFVVMIYSPNCPRSRQLYPQLTAFSQVRSVPVLAFSTVGGEDLSAFLGQQASSFPTQVVQAWESGEFTAAMQPIGIQMGFEFTMPVVAVLDNGHVVAQWQGLTSIEPVRAALAPAGG